MSLLNPGVVAMAQSVKQSAKDAAAKIAAAATSWTMAYVILAVISIIIVVIVIYVLVSKNPTYETATNIRTKIQACVKAQNLYAQKARGRIGLNEYVTQEIRKGLTPSELALTNFYVSTVNATGFFFPAIDGVFSPEAARIAVLAGARAFVFDIWPDLTPGAQFGPVLQIVQEGSKWRRISLNSLQFQLVLKALIEETFEIQGRPGSGDPVYIYLRFQGTQRSQTLNGTAAALRSIIEPYRLPFVYNNRGRQLQIYSEPIGNFLRKVIVCANVTGENTSLQDFINVGPMDGFKLEWGPNDAKGVTSEGKLEAIRKLKSALTWIAPPLHSPVAENNQYDQQASWDLGIQFCAMNFWADNDKIRDYMKPDKFGLCSFRIKPEHLRYKIEVIPAAKAPPPTLKVFAGAGESAGAPILPREIDYPK